MKRENPATIFLPGFLLAAAVVLAWSTGLPNLALRRAGSTVQAQERDLRQAVVRGQAKQMMPLLQQASPQALHGLPLAFVENRGQADARAAFMVQGRDTTAYFTAQGLTLALTQGAAKTRQRWNLKLDFVGAIPAALPSGKELANAQVSFFRGAPEQWRTGIKSYSSIVYRDLWPGIDLVYSGTTNRLKYEFVVNPGADPRQIKLAYRGANAPVTVNNRGQLEISTPFGVIHDDKPTSFQSKGKQVKTEFAVHERAADGSQQYGFKVGKYDRRKKLVIDPAILIYSGFIGGSGDDEGHSITVDGNGYAYVTGVTTSAQASFPEVAGPDLTYNGRTDAFVAKLNTDGSGLVYAGYIGGEGDDAGHSIAIDAGGNAYVTGWTSSTQATFPVAGTLGATFGGAIDAFVAKINPAGTALTYCGYIGGDDEDEGLGIAVDASGRAYLTGLTASTEATFPKLVGPGLLFKGAIDAFVARVKADGSGLDYAGYLGGSGDDQGRSIAVDAGGNAYVAGLTTSAESSFPMAGALDPSFNGGTDAFVAKVNSTGSAVSYSGFIGGGGIDEAYGIAVDSAGNAYLTGRTNSTEATFPKLIGPDLTFNGGMDAFVAKINSAGSALSYAGYIGSDGDDEGFGIAVDSAGNAFVTGRTASGEATFPKANAFDLTLNGASDGFLAKVNSAGSGLGFAGFLGGNGLEEGFGTAVNGLRQIYVAGRSTSDAGFPTQVGPGLIFGGGSDAFVMRVDDSSVTCAPLAISPAMLPDGLIGVAYNQSLTGSGGVAPYSFTIVNGALPSNLTLSSAGAISGTSAQAGNFNLTVMVTDANGCTGMNAYSLTITNCPAITVNPSSLPASTSFTFFSQTITASGGASPYTFTVSAGALPTGVTLLPSGLLSGAPTVAGGFNFTIRATDQGACFGEQPYTLNITANPGQMFYPLAAPVRLLDTRAGTSGCVTGVGPIAANTTRTQPARTVCSTIPANATAIIGNITVVPAGPGYLTLFPSDATQPTVANSNFKAGEVTNNFFTVGLGTSGADAGAFKIVTSATTDVIIDLTGYYAPPSANGLYYHPLPAPVRLVQTFPGQTGCFANPTVTQLQGTNDPNANPALDLPVQGRSPGLPSPCNSIPSDAVVLVGNATTVFPSAPFGFGYLTIYPSDATRPTVASSNYGNNDIINGPFAVKLGADGRFKIYSFSTTHLVVDISGYYSASATDANGAGLLFNPLPKPMRLLETRADFPGFPLTGCYRTNAPIAGSPNIRTQQAWGPCADQPPLTIPNTARALVGNVTVLNPVNAGFLTFFPGDVGTAPTVATSNYPFPVVFGYNRHYYVGLSPADGSFKMLTQFTSDLIADVSGFFAP